MDTRTLADDYTDACRALNQHWHNGDGGCTCGAPVSPCDDEVAAMRAVTAAEAAWLHEARRLEQMT